MFIQFEQLSCSFSNCRIHFRFYYRDFLILTIVVFFWAPNIIIGQTYCQKALIADVLTLETHHTGSFGIWLIVIRSKHLQACSIPFYIVSKHILVQEILTQNNLSHLSAYLGTAMTKLQSIPRNNKVYKGIVTQLQCIPRHTLMETT